MPGEEVDILDSCACSGANLPRFVQPVLLALLAQEPVHGYALVRKLADTGLFDRFRPTVYAYGFLSGLLYGIVLDSWHVIGYISPLTWEGALLSYGAGLPFNVVHGVATAAFLLALYAPWRRKLERIRAKYALMGED